MTMDARQATEADIPDLVAMGRRLFNRAGWPDWVTCTDEAMAATARSLMASDSGAVFIHPYGCAGVIISPAYFNAGILAAHKVWWWAEPGHLPAHRILFSVMEEWARGMGAAIIFTSTPEAINPVAISRIYERMGYTAADRRFMKRL